MKKLFKGILSSTLAFTVLLACLVFAPVSGVAAAETIAVKATSAIAEPGETFTVDIDITSNPGIVSMRLFVEYDTSVLTLVSAEDKGVLGTSQFSESKDSPFALVWSNGASYENYTVTGTIATLTFKVLETVTKNSSTTVTLTTKSENDILSVNTSNYDLIPVTPSFTNSTVTIYPFNFYGASLTLYDDISMSFMVNKQVLDEFGYTDAKVTFVFNTKETVVTDYYDYGGGLYAFDFNNIGPKQLKDVVSATLSATKNGKTKTSPVKDFSVASYCYQALDYFTGDAYAELRTLAVDLLNFGSAVQVYDKYKTDNLANAELTEVQKAMGTSTAPEIASDTNTKYETIDNPTVSWYSASLYLYDTVEMRFIIRADDITNLRAKVQSKKTDKVWYIDASDFVSAGSNFYYFDFDKFQAVQMREVVLVTVLNGDTPVSNTLSYDIESYAHQISQLTDPQYDTLKDVTVAMMKYGDSAYNFRY